MSGSSVAGKNPGKFGGAGKGSSKGAPNPVKLGGAGKGTSTANTGLKKVSIAKGQVSKNQHLNTKSHPGNYGQVQGLTMGQAKKSIHKSRGGKVMKAMFGGRV